MPLRALFLALVCVVLACAPPAPEEGATETPTSQPEATVASPRDVPHGLIAPLVFPTDDASWPTVSPASAGWDVAKLNAALDFAGSRDTRAIVILQDGKLLAERYWLANSNFMRDIASAQKSVVSVLVGIAVDKQLLSLDERVTPILGAGWSNTGALAEARITVRHLLTMTSGLNTSLGLQAAPGTTWLYNNDAYHRLRMILERRTGLGIDALSHAWLFNTLGATRSQWEQRSDVDSKGLPLWGLTMSARDLARFGLLLLADGAWAGTRVVSSAYLNTATNSSQTLNPAYGHLFWLNGKAFTLIPPLSARIDGPLIPSAPQDVFAGLGKDDQKVYVSRSLGLVVTRLGAQAGTRSAETLSDFDEELWARIMAARL
ncbi:serine hydrolase [Myxococcus llanfairpwllgwyngyllgogerychwyrndrobwllllantysiliogogogochensis]|uniref:Serine hydrolase n=1 Tax=Myxococcus llanfairpwllgwyngyllgogerychwyrndrobwllllantysiliogogogochensis TaxID=2590453 RepID=A0A540X5X6_9BACT|nr:serine hydrolase [Myxococcus llanfairpwllgwyngyllgogerychwyrndrobwllllantysiliogogogochensis]TQF16657.1 serine hydrolase [Myxococcus llanfairpwllgwyngyllgogerychwyrndrobwllllantysiliogogogochensis]